MRSVVDARKVRALFRALGARSTGPGRVYVAGGATAVLIGWRDTTIDVDLKLDPEPPGAFAAIAAVKDQLDINVELASPDQFVPAVPGWRERSLHVETHGSVEFFHYDPVGQALAKIERSHARDLVDVTAMASRSLVDAAAITAAFESIRGDLERYPAIDVAAFEGKVRRFVEGLATG